MRYLICLQEPCKSYVVCIAVWYLQCPLDYLVPVILLLLTNIAIFARFKQAIGEIFDRKEMQVCEDIVGVIMVI